MQVIPAIDVLDGKVVRLKQGDFNAVTTFTDDPLTYAKKFEEEAANRLHLVDLSGSKDGKLNLLELIKKLSDETSLRIQVGGGVRSVADAELLIDAGADSVILGTVLFSNLQEAKKIVQKISTKRCIATLDVRNNEVQIAGWEQGSGTSLFEACTLVQNLGIQTVLITAIECDGMEQGPNVGLYKEVSARFPDLQIIASGGVRNKEDIDAVEEAGCSACVVGRALLSGEIEYEALMPSLDCARDDTKEEARDDTKNQDDVSSSDLCVRIIPCLDIKDGRTVKGTSFQDLRDAGDPVELTKKYCNEGADELVFLDITATYEGRDTVYDLVSRIANVVNIPFTIGGGVRTVDDAKKLLSAGADKVAVNSAAVKNPALLSDIASVLGSANVVCAIDAKRKGNSWTVLSRGGRDDAGIDAIDWAKKAVKRGAGELLVTSFDRDGTGEGFDIDLLKAIKQEVTVPIIASGGAGDLRSFLDAVSIGKADAVLAASVFHFETLSIAQVKQFLFNSSYPVRL